MALGLRCFDCIDGKEEEGTVDSAPEGRILINGNPFCVVDLYHQ